MGGAFDILVTLRLRCPPLEDFTLHENPWMLGYGLVKVMATTSNSIGSFVCPHLPIWNRAIHEAGGRVGSVQAWTCWLRRGAAQSEMCGT